MKRILSIILGVFLLATPLAGCLDFLDEKPEDKATGVVMTFENDGDMSIKKDGETLLESKYSSAYYVSFKDRANMQESSRYLLEDSSLKEELYSVFSGKTITLEKTEETAMPNGLSMKIFLMPNNPMEFTVAKDGALWYCYDKNNETVYYSSHKEEIPYVDLYEVFKGLDYEYSYILKEAEDGAFIFGTEEQTEILFYRNDVFNVGLSRSIDSNPSWIDDDVWISNILNIIGQKEISFRICQEERYFLEYDLDLNLQNEMGENIIIFVFGLDGYIYFFNQTSGIAYISDFSYLEEQISLWDLKRSWLESK